MPAVKISKRIGSGSECEVFDVGEGRCYKKYFYPSNVNAVYENAKKAFEAGIAPKVYGKDENGYYTEIVETFSHLCDNCNLNYECSECLYFFEIIDRFELDELDNKLCEIFGDGFHDLYIFNIGLKNGKLVAIDFGMASGLGN